MKLSYVWNRWSGRLRAGAGERGAGRPGVIGFGLLVLVIGFVLYQSARLEAYSCEVCVEFEGREKCRTVGGPTIDGARSGAILNACAYVASGMANSMACQRKPPVSETCE